MHDNPLILIADDDASGNCLLRMAFAEVAPDFQLEFVVDGRQAIDYLQDKPPFQPRPNLPDLLLLDIKMPVLDGFGVLEWLAQVPQCRPEYVITFSTSDDSRDMDQAWVLGADAYLVKPIKFADLLHQVRAVTALLRTGLTPPDPGLTHLRLRPF